jgi:hypothetical protein
MNQRKYDKLIFEFDFQIRIDISAFMCCAAKNHDKDELSDEAIIAKCREITENALNEEIEKWRNE